MRRVREQYRRAIRVHRAQQRRFWRQKWIARFVAAWRAVTELAAQVGSATGTAMQYMVRTPGLTSGHLIRSEQRLKSCRMVWGWFPRGTQVDRVHHRSSDLDERA